ncbi:hypothetical protein L3Q82_000163 [Scortum barcoo]|uniref:Uncharacterized protein n=1 Tax=Scortum barcoo TaxID=214431 RepID=A0ACB8XDJ3_9TELE|nr:hypothetical protein L3Q82_000163 [Scortum barcoo]
MEEGVTESLCGLDKSPSKGNGTDIGRKNRTMIISELRGSSGRGCLPSFGMYQHQCLEELFFTVFLLLCECKWLSLRRWDGSVFGTVVSHCIFDDCSRQMAAHLEPGSALGTEYYGRFFVMLYSVPYMWGVRMEGGQRSECPKQAQVRSGVCAQQVWHLGVGASHDAIHSSVLLLDISELTVTPRLARGFAFSVEPGQLAHHVQIKPTEKAHNTLKTAF